MTHWQLTWPPVFHSPKHPLGLCPLIPLYVVSLFSNDTNTRCPSELYCIKSTATNPNCRDVGCKQGCGIESVLFVSRSHDQPQGHVTGLHTGILGRIDITKQFAEFGRVRADF